MKELFFDKNKLHMVLEYCCLDADKLRLFYFNELEL